MDAKIMMLCQDEAVQKDAGEMFKRVSAALAAVDTFSDQMCDLDEDAPDLADQAAPLIIRLTLTLMQLYPNLKQLTADVKTIGDFTVRTI